MTMRYRDPFSVLNDSRRRAANGRRLAWRAGIFLIVVASVIILRTPLSAFASRALLPFDGVRAFTSRAASFIAAPFSSKAALMQEVDSLSLELVAARNRAADRDVLYAENAELKRFLGRAASSTEERRVLAGVIARPPQLPYDTLLIDAGTRDGVAAGDFVWAGNTGSVIGTVSEVLANSARVVLFSSAGQTHEGFLNGATPVTVEGDGAGALSAKVPAGVDVSVGDAVMLPGIEGGISETVAAIDAPQDSSFKTLYLHVPVNVFSLRLVEVCSTQAHR